MRGVVTSAVAQVDATDVGDVPRRVVAVLDDEELLVVRAEEPDALVEQDLAAGLVDLPPEQLVGLRAEGRRDPLAVGAPDEAADLHPGPCPVGQQVTDRRPVRRQPLVGVPPPVGEPDAVAGLQGRQLGLDAGEVRRPVHQRSHEVALGPRGAVVTTGVHLGRGVAAFVAGEEPVTRISGHGRRIRATPAVRTARLAGACGGVHADGREARGGPAPCLPSGGGVASPRSRFPEELGRASDARDRMAVREEHP